MFSNYSTSGISFLTFLYAHKAKIIITNHTITKYANLLGCCQIQILLIKQFLKPFTIYLTGFAIKIFFSHPIFTFSGFHKIPDSQKTAETKDLTKFPKSLLIAASNDENNDQVVQNPKLIII